MSFMISRSRFLKRGSVALAIAGLGARGADLVNQKAKRDIIDAGLLGKVGHAEVCCYCRRRAAGNPPVTAVPDFFDYELWTGPAMRRHRLDWHAAVEDRGRPVADIEEGHISTASCILASVLMQLERTLRYDPATRQVEGDEEGTRLLRRSYRGPWERPSLG